MAILMAKSFLILMLMMTQLLTGSGALYLCIRNDGSYCCLDAGPQSCTCCINEDSESGIQPTLAPQESCSGACGESDLSATNEENRAPRISNLTMVASNNPCGCTHLRLTNETAIRNARTASAPDSSAYASVVADLSTFASDDFGNRARFAFGKPLTLLPKRSHALTVLSWVSIQC